MLMCQLVFPLGRTEHRAKNCWIVRAMEYHGTGAPLLLRLPFDASEYVCWGLAGNNILRHCKKIVACAYSEQKINEKLLETIPWWASASAGCGWAATELDSEKSSQGLGSLRRPYSVPLCSLLVSYSLIGEEPLAYTPYEAVAFVSPLVAAVSRYHWGPSVSLNVSLTRGTGNC